MWCTLCAVMVGVSQVQQGISVAVSRQQVISWSGGQKCRAVCMRSEESFIETGRC